MSCKAKKPRERSGKLCGLHRHAIVRLELAGVLARAPAPRRGYPDVEVPDRLATADIELRQRHVRAHVEDLVQPDELRRPGVRRRVAGENLVPSHRSHPVLLADEVRSDVAGWHPDDYR